MPELSHELRYGVFLNPDAATSAAVTTVTGHVRAQYGLVSAGRFPPHVTLVGSLPVADEAQVLAAVEAVTRTCRSFEVHHCGISRLGESVVYDVHADESGAPNTALVGLAAAVREAVLPLLVDVGGLPADVSDVDWRGHLSLASHELLDRTDLRDEVETFIRELGVACPTRFRARQVTVYRLRHPSWTGPWWTDFTWQHVRSYPLIA